MADFAYFERAAEARAKLLRVERLGLAGADERSAPAFLLTFDAGRLLLTADALEAKLAVLHIPSADAAPGGLESADEHEPWWRLLGTPLCRAERVGDTSDALRLQFREDDDQPRRVRIERKGGSLVVRLEA